MPQLESLRLLLRSPEPGDIGEIAAALNDFEVSRNLAMVPFPYTQDDARAFIAKVTAGLATGEDYCFAIRRKTDNVLIGLCGLHLKASAFELGYWIAKAHWRQGYATEAAHRVLAFGFGELKADRIWAGWYHDNARSGRVLAKLGFKADHVEKQDCRARGEAVLCNRTLLTRAEFGRKRAA